MASLENLELPFLHLSYQKDMHVLFCRWRMPVGLLQFSEGYMTALQLAAQQDAYFWLHDLRLRNTSAEEERGCFTQTFAPATQALLGGNNFIAYLMLPLQLQDLVPEPRPTTTGPVKQWRYLTVHYFTNEHDALEWLNDCRLRVVA